VLCRFRYVGIDISQAALDEAHKNLLDLESGHIELVRTDYMEDLQQLKSFHPKQPLCIAWLGSSVSSLTTENVIEFFKVVIKEVCSTCQLLVSMGKSLNKQIRIYLKLKKSTQSVL